MQRMPSHRQGPRALPCSSVTQARWWRGSRRSRRKRKSSRRQRTLRCKKKLLL
jgi:hypothetical protein